ncbi:hypothetical protein Fmac_020469 [Flemingia macrophylla]|uniref:DUF7780 domain-containing protein n=1 Tax=Flemingia macrophylla TaxID=520843 RepID=A0ABD1LU32_9FABA
MGLFPKPNANTTSTSTSISNSSSTMGFLLVFFPEDNTPTPTPTPTATAIATNNNNNKVLSHSNKLNSKNALLSKAQSTISICLLLFSTTFLFFTLSNLKPSKPHNAPNDVVLPPPLPTALQRMGHLYLRGTRPMNGVVVCHVTHDTTHQDFALFLRLLHRSTLTSKSDVVFIFPSSSTTSAFAPILHRENHSFLQLVNLHAQFNSTRPTNSPQSTFNATKFFKPSKKGDPLWGKKTSSADGSEFTRASYGSVVSFDADELDPENSLAGFMNRVPMGLRRWACYSMLLGRVRRNFKHVMLVDVKSVVFFNDPLGRVRNRSADSVYVFPSGKHGRNSERTRPPRLVNSAILMGGGRGIRRVANAMLVAIVRGAMQHKRRNPVSDSAILSQLVGNEFAMRSVELVVSSESVPETSRNSAGSKLLSDYLMVQRGNNYDLNYILKEQICSSVIDSFVYSDCQRLQKAQK